MARILGLDTSNYTTSAALLQLESGLVLRQEKQLLPVKAGAAGLRQSDAVFHHTKQLPVLLERLGEMLQEETLCAIGVSDAPRRAPGSYMPCFLVGSGMARSLSVALGIPVFATSHQVGHILAALYSAGQLSRVDEPFLAFHVSGGTTDLLYWEPTSDHDWNITCCGTSLDLKAGQAIDRVGLQLGLQFPCGKALERLAMDSMKQDYLKPVIRQGNCCLSGLENRCQRLLEQGESPAEIAGFCLRSVGETLAAMVEAALAQYGALPVLYAGGVMSNHLIRPRLASLAKESWFAASEFACDNAAGTALYAYLQMKERSTKWQY